MEDFILKQEARARAYGLLEDPAVKRKKNRELTEKRKLRAIEANIYSGLEVTGPYDIPVLKRDDIDIPERMLPYGEWTSTRDADAAVCFYTHDYRYSHLRTDVEWIIEKIKNAQAVVSPDFSQTADMPYWERFHNSCLNKAVGAKFQQHGIKVVPNVTWSLPDSYAYSFVGFPKNGVIAINSMGADANTATRYLWHCGYVKALEVLKPKAILRYGPVMAGECESISKYYVNPFIERMRDGS